jgi:carbonic anhydrase/acetyltransferase-like protein (isoleucine patch superfamily)
VTPFILSYEAILPRFNGEPTKCGEACSVLGKAQIGASATLAANSVIRADGHFVRIGRDFHLGESSTVHIAHDLYPAIVGDGVTVGRNAVVHACTVADQCVIEDDVVILDGSVIEGGVVIEAGSVVFPRSRLTSGYVYAGSPAKPLRALTSRERSTRESRLRASIVTSVYSTRSNHLEQCVADDVFIAQTARLGGRISVQRSASIFFGCHFDAGAASIVIGERTNVQDNTHIRCEIGAVTIGRDTTIGHNVKMNDCRIGERAMVGIGSVISAGTIIDDDVLLAAGSVTNRDQHLERGWLWGGRPARPISELNDTRRFTLAQSVDQYCVYAHFYRLAQLGHPRPAEINTRDR